MLWRFQSNRSIHRLKSDPWSNTPFVVVYQASLRISESFCPSVSFVIDIITYKFLRAGLVQIDYESDIWTNIRSCLARYSHLTFMRGKLHVSNVNIYVMKVVILPLRFDL